MSIAIRSIVLDEPLVQTLRAARACCNASATMTRNNRGVFLISIAATRFISRSAYPKHTPRKRSAKITSTSFYARADTGAPA